MTFILFSGTDYESYTVLAFVVESDPSTHYSIKEEIELLIDPLLKLLSLQDDPVQLFKALDMLRCTAGLLDKL